MTLESRKRLAIARGLLRAEQRTSPLQPRPYWVIQRSDLLDYEERMAERGAKRGPKPRRRSRPGDHSASYP